MKISIRQLRNHIREALEEHANSWANYSRNALSPETDDREAIEKMSLKGDDGHDELSSHLQDADRVETDAEIWGPVPPKKNQNVFVAQSDPFAQDWNVIPTPRR